MKNHFQKDIMNFVSQFSYYRTRNYQTANKCHTHPYWNPNQNRYWIAVTVQPTDLCPRNLQINRLGNGTRATTVIRGMPEGWRMGTIETIMSRMPIGITIERPREGRSRSEWIFKKIGLFFNWSRVVSLIHVPDASGDPSKQHENVILL